MLGSDGVNVILGLNQTFNFSIIEIHSKKGKEREIERERERYFFCGNCGILLGIRPW